MVHGLLLKYSIRQHREKHVHSEHSGPLIINISLAIALLMKNYYVTYSKDTGIWDYVTPGSVGVWNSCVCRARGRRRGQTREHETSPNPY